MYTRLDYLHIRVLKQCNIGPMTWKMENTAAPLQATKLLINTRTTATSLVLTCSYILSSMIQFSNFRLVSEAPQPEPLLAISPNVSVVVKLNVCWFHMGYMDMCEHWLLLSGKSLKVSWFRRVVPT